MQGTDTRKRGSSPCCSRYAAAVGLMLGFPFVVPPPMIAAAQAPRLLLAGPPLPSKPSISAAFPYVPCLASLPRWGGSPKPPPPRAAWRHSPRPQHGGGCRLGASTAAGVRRPPSSSVVLPRLQAQYQQKTRFRYAPLRFLLELLFPCCSRFVRRPPRFPPPSSRLTHPRHPQPCPVSMYKNVQ